MSYIGLAQKFIGLSVTPYESESLSVMSYCLRPHDYTVHGILHTSILECVAFPFSRGSFQPRDRTHVSHIPGRRFNLWATREAQVANVLEL